MDLLLGLEAKVTNMVGAWVNKSSAVMLRNTRTEQYVNIIKKNMEKNGVKRSENELGLRFGLWLRITWG